MKKIKNKVIDVVSDILSAKPRWEAHKAIKKGDFETSILKEARNYKGKDVETFDKNGKHTRPFMVKTMANNIKADYAYKNKNK